MGQFPSVDSTATYRDTYGVEALRAFCRRVRPALLARFAPDVVKDLPLRLSVRNDDAWLEREGDRRRRNIERVGCDSVD